jgi:hypothetical protein
MGGKEKRWGETVNDRSEQDPMLEPRADGTLPTHCDEAISVSEQLVQNMMKIRFSRVILDKAHGRRTDHPPKKKRILTLT